MSKSSSDDMIDMIDFQCSSTFRNHYYDQGLTPYPDTSGPKKDLRYWENQVKEVRKEHDRLKKANEGEHNALQEQAEYYESKIEALHRHINWLKKERNFEERINPQQGSGFTGIKASSPWTEEEPSDSDPEIVSDNV